MQLIPGPPWDAATRKVSPHLVLNPPEDSELMQREIFGPVLPIIGYQQLAEAVAFINERPRPLAFYPFSRSRKTIEALLQVVMSGGVSVNDALWHVGQHDLPFGGVGASGMGHYHGREGFLTFSKLRPVFYQAPDERHARIVAAIRDTRRQGPGFPDALAGGAPFSHAGPS